jgi:type IV fimbrial biogenesis protein FimT
MGRQPAGFTLLEMMVVLSIMGILVAFALPSFGWLSASTKVKNASTELYLALLRARSESVKRNRGVAIVATSGDEDHWEAGWRVIADSDNDGAYNGADDLVVIEQGPLQRVVITMAADTVIYRPTGRVSAAAKPEFDVQSDDADYATLERCVSADLTGKPYIKTTGC